MQVRPADSCDVGIVGRRIYRQIGIPTVIGAGIARGGKERDTLGGALLKNSVEGLQLGASRAVLAESPTGGCNLCLVVGDDLVIGIVQSLRGIGPFVDNLVGMRGHCRHDFHI